MQAFSELNLIGVGIRHDHHTNSKNFANSLLVEANLALLDTKLLVHAGNSVYFDIPEGLRWHAAGSRGTVQKHAIFIHFHEFMANWSQFDEYSHETLRSCRKLCTVPSAKRTQVAHSSFGR